MILRPKDSLQPNPQGAARFVLPETTVFAAIGCADLLYTIYLMGSHHASESNPIMSGILDLTGPWGFVAAKAALIAVPLSIAEYARRHREQFTRSALRIGILLYVGLYAALWLRYNS